MLRTRLIACIVVKDGIAVQSIGFNRFLPIGSPAILAENLNRWGVDEILLQDISKPRNGETPSIFFIRSVAAECLIPLTAAGGVKVSMMSVMPFFPGLIKSQSTRRPLRIPRLSKHRPSDSALNASSHRSTPRKTAAAVMKFLRMQAQKRRAKRRIL